MINRIGDSEAKEALSPAGRVENFCLLDVRLYKTDVSSDALRRLAFRIKMSKVMVYMVEGTERRADGKEDRRWPA
jgi:hypothetical protein